MLAQLAGRMRGGTRRARARPKAQGQGAGWAHAPYAIWNTFRYWMVLRTGPGALAGLASNWGSHSALPAMYEGGRSCRYATTPGGGAVPKNGMPTQSAFSFPYSYRLRKCCVNSRNPLVSMQYPCIFVAIDAASCLQPATCNPEAPARTRRSRNGARRRPGVLLMIVSILNGFALATCEPFCADDCDNLTGDVATECGTCATSFACHPFAANFRRRADGNMGGEDGQDSIRTTVDAAGATDVLSGRTAAAYSLGGGNAPQPCARLESSVLAAMTAREREEALAVPTIVVVIHGNPAAIGTNVSTVDESSVSSAAAVVATPMRSLVDETNPFDTVAALLYRPLPKITAAVRAITAEMLPPSHTISVHVRAQVKTLIQTS